MKSKLGISVGLIGAATYFVALFGGLTPVLLLAGYVLLFESNEWLRKNVVKAVALSLFFLLILALINLIPNILSIIVSFLNIFGINFNFGAVYSIIDVFTGILNILEKCLFLILGLNALTQGSVSIPFIDKMINEHLK